MESKKVIFFSFGDKSKAVSKEHVFLSNFFEAEFVEDGIKYKTVEHYFQSQKAQDSEQRHNIVTANSPTIAKRLGRGVDLDRTAWLAIRDQVMKRALQLKFSQNPELKEKLMLTFPRILKEFSRRDKYWGGSCKNSLNRLGIMLMELREDLLKNH